MGAGFRGASETLPLYFTPSPPPVSSHLRDPLCFCCRNLGQLERRTQRDPQGDGSPDPRKTCTDPESRRSPGSRSGRPAGSPATPPPPSAGKGCRGRSAPPALGQPCRCGRPRGSVPPGRVCGQRSRAGGGKSTEPGWLPSRGPGGGVGDTHTTFWLFSNQSLGDEPA